MTVTNITGSKTHGILLGQGSYGSTLTITNTGKITGPLYGVYASPRFLGDATINNAGSIRAGTIGVDTPVYGNITNTGNVYGTIAGVYLSSGTLLNQGIIAGKTFALIASGNYNSAKNPAFIKNASTGKIIGTDVGVLLRPNIEQQITFINSGTITGNTVGLGVSDNSNYGIGPEVPTDAATIINQAGGIIGASNGIGVYLSVSSTFERITFNNSGAVSGKLFGAYIYNSTINNTGLVTGNTYGIAIGSGLVANTGTIFGTKDGISLGTISATIFNNGTISGGANAIYGRVAFTLGVGEGAMFNGDVIDKSNNGELILLGTNAATLTGIGTSFQGFSTLAFAPGANGTAEGNIGGLAAGETIMGFTFGDTLTLDGFSATSESITGTGIVLSNGISTETLNISNAEFYQNFSLSSAAGKTTIAFQHINSLITTISTYIPGQVTPGSRYFGSLLTITNTGKVQSIYSVFGAPSGTIYNFGTIANITRPTSIDTIHNYGVIIDNGSIYSLSAASLTNAGTILGLSTFQAEISIGKNFSNTGTIIAENTGIQLSGGHISNSGLIAGQVKFAGGFLYNSGIISSNNTGLSESVFGSYINNTGLIDGTTLGVSVLYNSRSSFTNSGTIIGGSTGLQSYGAAITDAGLISGGTFALYNRDHLNRPQYNFTLTLDPGASFSGAVVDATNRGTLVFAGVSAGSIDIGTSFSGFQKIEFSAGSDWTVEGSASLVDGQNIYRFLAGETLILDNFVATSDSFVTGTGLVLSNQTQSETIQLIGNFATENFNVTSLAGKTKIVSQATTLTPLSTISTSFNRPIVLNSYYYTNNLSITNSGTIIPPSGGIALSENFTFSNPTIVNAGLLGAIDINNTGTITNLGTIFGTASVYLLEGTVNNFGLISNFGNSSSTSKNISGFVLTVDNYGSIENDAVGISLLTGTVFNSGFISGSSHGIYFENSGNVDNSGTILGGITSNAALNLTIAPNSTIAGPVTTGDGQIILTGTNAGSINIASSFTGFTDIDFAAGSTWNLEGASLSVADGQTISGFLTGDTIILDSFVATADTFVPGVGLVLSNATAAETFSIFGNFSSSNFFVSTHAGKTEIISNAASLIPTSTIASTFDREIVLGSAYYSAQLSITNTGVIIPPNGVGIYAPFVSSNDGITNSGTVSDIYLRASGTISNSGLIIGQRPILFVSNGTITNTGIISGPGANGGQNKAIDVAGYGFVNNSGSIFNAEYGVVAFGGTIINMGYIGGHTDSVFIYNSGELIDSGTLSGGVKLGGNSTFVAQPGLKLSGPVTANTSTLALAGTTAGSLDIGTSFTGFSNIEFTAGATWSLEAGSIAIAAGQTISGFTYGDTIILDNFVVNTLDTTYVSGTGLELTDTLGNHLTLDITGNFSTASFIVIDPPGDTTIEAVCYLRGTRIATPAGDMPIESLRIGDTVITRFNGYRKIKWIGRQIFAPRFIAKNPDQIPVRITAGALARNIPLRDLFVSPGHSMLIGQNLILAKNLVNGVTVTQPAPSEDVHHYQLEFETHDCVLAEGAWSESYADTPDLRGQFHNAGDFWHRFPDHAAPVEQILCAPRPLEGPGLEAALRPLAASAAARTSPGRLHGFIDAMTDHNIEGWAWDESNQHLPVLLEILVNNHRLGTALACQPRTDLKAAGYGQGNCGFMFASPLGLPVESAQIQIRRVSDGATLNHLNRRAA